MKYNVYRERGYCLINKYALVFKNMSHDCLGIFIRTCSICSPRKILNQETEGDGRKEEEKKEAEK